MSAALATAVRLLRYPALALVGALLGYLMEGVHQRAGVWEAATGDRLPLWIIPVYFVGLLVVTAFLGVVERRTRRRILAWQGLALEAALLLVLAAAPPLMQAQELLLAAGCLGYLMVRMALARWPGDLLVVAVFITLDLLVEWILVSQGLYSYSVAQYLPLPLWLAPLWGGIGLGLRRLLGAVTRKE